MIIVFAVCPLIFATACSDHKRSQAKAVEAGDWDEMKWDQNSWAEQRAVD